MTICTARDDDELRALKDKLTDAIVDGRMKLLKAVAAIARAVDMSPTKTRRALEAGEIQRAWRTASGRWFAIKPRLLEAESQLRPGQSDD